MWKVPGRDTAPGPGRADAALIAPFPVTGMQNTDASVASFGTPGLMAPAAAPFSVMLTHVVLPKHPTEVWLGQNRPFANVLLAGPVERGERSTAIVPAKVPSMQALFTVQGCVASAPPDGQSRVTPCEFVLVQACVARGPRSQVPVAGLAGLPFTGTPPL